MIPLSVPNFEGNERKYVEEAVSQGWVSTGGAYITQLENSIASFLNVDDAVACQSGTAALHLALMECGLREGECVIVPTLTFIAAVNPVKYCGAEPIFMDCDDTLCLDPNKLEQFCKEECELRTDGLYHKVIQKRIRAMVVVHVFGNMADMEAITEIAKKYKVLIVEDATEALGTRYLEGKYKEKFAGTIGDFGAFSFNGNKIITTGGGGMVVTKNKTNLEHIRFISTQAKNDPLFYIHNEIGYNYRMTNVQAAIGVAQMEELSEFIRRKNENYEQYKMNLKDIRGIRLLEFCSNVYSNKWFYSLVLSDGIKISAKEMVYELSKRQIQTRCIWDLIHKQKPYQNCMAYKIEKANYYAERIINLPCSTNLKKNEIEEVCNKIDIILEHLG